MSNNKQSSNHIPDVGNMVSSVEFIKNNLERLGMLDNGKVITNIFEQAKEMHKEEKKQVLKDYFAWHKSKGFVSHKKEDIEEFINETFGGNNEQQ